MSKSLIQTANQSSQAVTENGIISLGSVQRRFGCNLWLSGNAIECRGAGYYTITSTVSVAPTVAGNVTVALFDNGVQIPGAIAYGYAATAETPVTLPLEATIRQGYCCDSVSDIITVVLLEGAGNVENITVRVEKA